MERNNYIWKQNQKIMKNFLIILLVLFSFSVKAQIPSNIGFDGGDLTGWQSFISGDISCTMGNPGTAPTGSNCNYQVSNSNPFDPIQTCYNLGFNQQILTNFRIKIVDTSTSIYSNLLGTTLIGVDPISHLPIVCPTILNNKYSLKLGDDQINDSAETVSVQFAVTHQNQFLTYKYSAVLDLPPGHDYCQEPRLEFLLYDLGPVGNHYASKVKDTFSLIISTPKPSNPPLGWFIVKDTTNTLDTFLCTNWLPFSMDLSSYYNHDIELDLTTSDCALGAHAGYAYIDFDTLFYPQTLFCQGDTAARLIAPAGYSNYTWNKVGNTTPILSGNYDSLVVYHPTLDDMYSVSFKSPYSHTDRTLFYKIQYTCRQANSGVSSILNDLSNKLIIAPNPCTDELKILNTDVKIKKVEIIDLLGRTVFEPIIYNASFATNELTSGIYFLKATDEKAMIHTAKFVKE